MENKNFINSKKNKIKVYWDDLPENYSKESKNRVRSFIAKKYDIPKSNINVMYRAVGKVGDSNQMIDLSNMGISNIMDIAYQRSLIKKWLENNKREIDIDRLFKLDDKINGDVNLTINEGKHRRWYLKNLKINNFMCFGDDNSINFEKFHGLNIVNSIPTNQGGKTTFNIDAIMFLFYGTTTKTKTFDQVFNRFRTDKDYLDVEGDFQMDNEDLSIQRILTRKKTKKGDYKISHELKYYRILPDGDKQILKDDDATQTTKKIAEFIGSQSDFEITTLSTALNLDDLIGLLPTENSKMINRFIGLSIIDDKLKACRDRYNIFNRKKLGNHYDIVTLETEIEKYRTDIKSNIETINDKTIELKTIKIDLKDKKNTRDFKMSSKVKIDDDLKDVNTSELKNDLSDLKKKGISLNNLTKKLTKEINDIGDVTYDEVSYDEKNKKYNKNQVKINVLINEISRLEKEIKELQNSEICLSCKRPLDGIDNSDEIDKRVQSKDDKIAEKNGLITENESLSSEIDELKKQKDLVDNKYKLELNKEKNEVQVKKLRNDYTEINSFLTKYNKNEENITNNKTLDREIDLIDTQIKVIERSIKKLDDEISDLTNDNKTYDKEIKVNESNIIKLKSEEEIEKIYKLYIDIFGKNGIGKMVLRNVLPIINSELGRLMEDVCDFNVELTIDDKNNINYSMIADGIYSPLKSGSGLEKTIASLCLRTVLGKMAYLPMPNFISFDEVLGRVSQENIVKLEVVFDKIKELYDMVFLITHNNLVKDWGDHIITMKKINRVSKIETT